MLSAYNMQNMSKYAIFLRIFVEFKPKKSIYGIFYANSEILKKSFLHISVVSSYGYSENIVEGKIKRGNLKNLKQFKN